MTNKKLKNEARKYISSLLVCYYYNLERLEYLEALRDEKAQLLDNISCGHGVSYEYKVPSSNFATSSRESDLVLTIASIEKDIERLKERIKFYEEKENLKERIRKLRDKDKYIINQYFVLGKSCGEIAKEKNCCDKTIEHHLNYIYDLFGDVLDYGTSKEEE